MDNKEENLLLNPIIEWWPTALVLLILFVALIIWYKNRNNLEKTLGEHPIYISGFLLAGISFLLFIVYPLYPIINVNQWVQWLISFLLGLTLFVVPATIELYQRNNKLREDKKKLDLQLNDYKSSENLINEINVVPKPEHLVKYCSRKINNALAKIKRNIEGISQIGFSGDLNDKIEILEELLKHEANQKQITNFLATSLDKPSDVWKVNNEFWALQAEHLKSSNKIRITVLTSSELNEEVTHNAKDLKEYILWHKSNGFKLRFIILNAENDGKSELRNKILRYVRDENLILNDFAIVNDSFVYGEDFDNNFIKLISNTSDSNRNIISAYNNFFINLLERKYQDRVLSERSSEHILGECERLLDHNKFNIKSKLIDLKEKLHYNNVDIPSKFEYVFDDSYNDDITGESYNEFLSSLFVAIANENQNLIALDLTPAKSGFLMWVNNPEYNKWMKRSIDAAKKGCKCERLFIVDEDESGNIHNIVENIFLPQINSGIKLYVVSEFELIDRGISYYDFLLVNDVICHSLNMLQTLNDDSNNNDNPKVSLSRNLEHSNSFSRFNGLYDDIINAKKPLKSLVRFDNPTKEEIRLKLEDFFKNKIRSYE